MQIKKKWLQVLNLSSPTGYVISDISLNLNFPFLHLKGVHLHDNSRKSIKVTELQVLRSTYSSGATIAFASTDLGRTLHRKQYSRACGAEMSQYSRNPRVTVTQWTNLTLRPQNLSVRLHYTGKTMLCTKLCLSNFLSEVYTYKSITIKFIHIYFKRNS